MLGHTGETHAGLGVGRPCKEIISICKKPLKAILDY